jgi:hypothetical protein
VTTPSPAETLHLVERRRIVGAVERGGRGHAELVARLEDKRPHRTPTRTESERAPPDRILPPLPWIVAGEEVDADVRLRLLRAVIAPQREDGGGGTAADVEPVHHRAPVRQRAEVGGERLVHEARLRREERDQGVVRRRGDRGAHRRALPRRRLIGVARVPPRDRVHRVEDRDVDDRHRPTRPTWAQLLAEDARLARGDGRMVEPGRVDCDLVPVTDRSDRSDRVRRATPGRRRHVRAERVTGPPEVVDLVQEAARRCERSKASGEGSEASGEGSTSSVHSISDP